MARFAYNWALNKWQEDYKNGVKCGAYSLIKHLNSVKKDQFPWMQETSKTCSQYAIHNLESAYKRMWKIKSGYPKFKKKGLKDSFLAIENSQAYKQSNYKIHIPRVGKVRCDENLRFKGKVLNVTVKRIADMWFAVVKVDTEEPIPVRQAGENQTVVGIDMGIKSMLILSDGTIYNNPKALKNNLKGLKRLQRCLNRRQKGSKNRRKQQVKVARKHYRISCIRKEAIHVATSSIVKRFDKIIIETLSSANLVKNKKLSQSINDVSFGEIARQLEYKSAWQGKELIKASRWFASSKTCCGCGNKKDVLKLSERVYRCEVCGLSIDRDLNAAKNLAKYSPTSGSEGCEACGVSNSSSVKKRRGTMKQETIDLSNNLCRDTRNLKNL